MSRGWITAATRTLEPLSTALGEGVPLFIRSPSPKSKWHSSAEPPLYEPVHPLVDILFIGRVFLLTKVHVHDSSMMFRGHSPLPSLRSSSMVVVAPTLSYPF